MGLTDADAHYNDNFLQPYHSLPSATHSHTSLYTWQFSWQSRNLPELGLDEANLQVLAPYS
jgi:hypothetical protein